MNARVGTDHRNRALGWREAADWLQHTGKASAATAAEMRQKAAEIETEGPGQSVCCLCGKALSGTVVGCGDGTRTGRDGYFAHLECYGPR